MQINWDAKKENARQLMLKPNRELYDEFSTRSQSVTFEIWHNLSIKLLDISVLKYRHPLMTHPKNIGV